MQRSETFQKVILRSSDATPSNKIPQCRFFSDKGGDIANIFICFSARSLRRVTCALYHVCRMRQGALAHRSPFVVALRRVIAVCLDFPNAVRKIEI